ncbi:hypothetical protein [Agrobacterium cavarae]|uniref:hypothetical protein n=1 Tax=Agrobacterium cavarae TaxID=2528239 RepID=UPI0028A67C3C|nr:hypothetical protein [Agrobacterium cavarae]
MSRDISPRSSTPLSASGRLEQGQSLASVAPAQQNESALIVGLVLACARRKQGNREIPLLLLDRLQEKARSGDPTCRLVLNFLYRKAHDALREVSTHNVPAEIVSADPATKEGR